MEVLGRPEVAAIRELQSSSLEGIGGTCGILTGPELGPFADVGVTGRDPDKDGVPDETALLLSLAISGSLGDGCEDAEAEFLELTDAGEALRESRAAGGKESYGDRVALRGYPFEDAIGWSRSLRAEETIKGDGRTDLSNILGFGSDVAVSVCRRESS